MLEIVKVEPERTSFLSMAKEDISIKQMAREETLTYLRTMVASLYRPQSQNTRRGTSSSNSEPVQHLRFQIMEITKIICSREIHVCRSI